MSVLHLIRPCRIFLLLLTLFASAAGCGQKGDLYLPDKSHASRPDPAGPA